LKVLCEIVGVAYQWSFVLVVWGGSQAWSDNARKPRALTSELHALLLLTVEDNPQPGN